MDAGRISFGPFVGVFRRPLEIAVLLLYPLLFEAVLLGKALNDGILGIDVEQGLLPPARAIRDGISPFAEWHYPPLIPLLLVPFTFVPSAPIVVSALALASVPLSLWALGIDDWRCYGAALLWAPVFSGIQTANATLFLVCAACLAWRYRDRAPATAAAAGLAIGAKLISWPLAAWLAATGRTRGAAGAVAVALVTTVGFGALLEMTLGGTGTASVSGFGQVTTATETPSYSVVDVSRSLGLPGWAGMAAFAAAMLVLVALTVVLGRRGDDVRSFSVACLACLVAAPNVWLHSFAFLLPVVALLRPRFSAAWLVPVLFVVAPVIDPSPRAIAYAWLIAAGLSLWLLGAPSALRTRLFVHGATATKG